MKPVRFDDLTDRLKGLGTMADLIVQSGKHRGKKLVVPPKEMYVGRDDDCDLRIASSLVSRKHCTLKSMPDGGVLVTDLESQNGTYINDVPVTEPTLMRAGDVLRIGATLLALPAAQKSRMTLDSHHANISEAEIAGWLTDSSTGFSGASGFSGTDTAIIGSFPIEALEKSPLSAAEAPTPKPATIKTPAPAPAPKPAAPTAKPVSSNVSSKQLSIKDEAALVIQKHWESVKAKQKPS